jgi:ABC-2 type transport system permease protein
MSVYLTVARHSFRRHATYRLTTAAGAVTNTLFGFVRAAVLIALWHSRPHLGGYDVTDAVTFCFLTQALLATVAVLGPPLELSERVRTGEVVVDLYRPVDLQAWWLASDLGRVLFQALARAVPIFAAGAAFFTVRLPETPAAWALALASVALAVVVGFAVRYLLALASFWLVDDRGVLGLAYAVGPFLAGLFVPLVLFPDWLRWLAGALPWAAMLQAPADVFLGTYSGWRLAGALGGQLAWAVALLAAGRLLTGVARRKVVVQGG